MKKIVIDMHVHPAFLEPVCKTECQNEFAKKMYGLYKTDQIPVDALLTLMDCSGVDKAVLLPLDLTTEYGGILGTNDQIKELTATYPDRFIGFASVDPHRPDATEILETAFAEYHLAGLKLHPSKQKFYPGVTVINIEKINSEIKINMDEDNLDGLNYLSGKTLDFVNKKAMEGTIAAHVEGDVPNILINMEELNEETIGYLIYFFELACAMSGNLLGVDPFNQPGVEKYKTNMFKLLKKPGYEKN